MGSTISSLLCFKKRHAAVIAGLLLILVPVSARAADGEPPPSKIPASQVLESIANACNERRYTDVDELLYPTLRETWVQIGYAVKDYCDGLTHDGTLQQVRIDKEEEVGTYTAVYVTYIFRDGSEQIDRAAFLRDKGFWKLAG